MASGRCSKGGSRLPTWLMLDTGCPGQGHVGEGTSTDKDLRPKLNSPLHRELFF